MKTVQKTKNIFQVVLIEPDQKHVFFPIDIYILNLKKRKNI